MRVIYDLGISGDEVFLGVWWDGSWSDGFVVWGCCGWVDVSGGGIVIVIVSSSGGGIVVIGVGGSVGGSSSCFVWDSRVGSYVWVKSRNVGEDMDISNGVIFVDDIVLSGVLDDGSWRVLVFEVVSGVICVGDSSGFDVGWGVVRNSISVCLVRWFGVVGFCWVSRVCGWWIGCGRVFFSCGIIIIIRICWCRCWCGSGFVIWVRYSCGNVVIDSGICVDSGINGIEVEVVIFEDIRNCSFLDFFRVGRVVVVGYICSIIFNFCCGIGDVGKLL